MTYFSRQGIYNPDLNERDCIKYGIAVDIWNLGVIVYEILTGKSSMFYEQGIESDKEDGEIW